MSTHNDNVDPDGLFAAAEALLAGSARIHSESMLDSAFRPEPRPAQGDPLLRFSARELTEAAAFLKRLGYLD